MNIFEVMTCKITKTLFQICTHNYERSFAFCCQARQESIDIDPSLKTRRSDMDLSNYVNLAVIAIDICLPRIRDLCRKSLLMRCSCLFEQAVKLSAFSEITDLTALDALSFYRHPPPIPYPALKRSYF